jgi:integrase
MANRRLQHGYIFERSGAFYVKYWTTDGEAKRVQRSEQLCRKDAQHDRKDRLSVKLLAQQVMVKINGAHGDSTASDHTVEAFWNAVYLPLIEGEVKREAMHYSTLVGYKQMWSQHLKPKIGEKRIADYTTVEANRLLTELATKYGENTVKHVKNLARGIFKKAVGLGYAKANPWSDAEWLTAPKAAGKTGHYTREEIEDIISALVDRVDCQLFMALTYFAGLMPSETAGLKWSDVDEQWIHIRRAVVRGVVGAPKHENRVASVPVIEPVRTLLKLWREKSESADWMFPDEVGEPIDPRKLSRTAIVPTLKTAKLAWKGYYAARRGGGTEMEKHSNPLVAAQFMRNSPAVALRHYLKPSDARLLNAAKLLERG